MHRAAATRRVFAYSKWPQNSVQFRHFHLTRQSLTSSVAFLKSHPRNLGCHQDLVHRRVPPKPDDTVYALSTAEGKAGIAVIRVSGPSCRSVGFPCIQWTTMADGAF